ncbi:MAG: hypothetical protein AB1454_13165 [Candidatus Auribacterota bacterium]
MKRYRFFFFDYDCRANLLQPIPEHWHNKEQHIKNQKQTLSNLIWEYGEQEINVKKQNLLDIGIVPLSAIFFHNRFLRQIRNSYITGCYYPALTGACALGERILNHLLDKLKSHYKTTEEYKTIHRKKSIDDWEKAIRILQKWGVFNDKVKDEFLKLKEKRNNAIHFNPEVDSKYKNLALEAISIIQKIISLQFSPFEEQPWWFWLSGECYIKQEYESVPFIKEILIPNCQLVGPNHLVESLYPLEINDPSYENKEITDEQFKALRETWRSNPTVDNQLTPLKTNSSTKK